MRNVKPTLALAALSAAALIAATALYAQEARDSGSMMGRGMVGGGGMMGGMSGMMDHCAGMMSGHKRGNRPNDQWRQNGPPAPYKDG